MKPMECLQAMLDGAMLPDTAEAMIEEYICRTGESSANLCALRALRALDEGKIIDFCGHLRQCMSFHHRPFAVGKPLYDRISPFKVRFGLTLSAIGGQYKVAANETIAPGVTGCAGAFELARLRKQKPSIGDGRLVRYFRHREYISLAQKAMMAAISHMESGGTLLACLPTGGGKSLAWQLPAISGEFDGLTIVVVPTTALAINHRLQTDELYARAKPDAERPRAYYSGEDGPAALEAIRAGSLPVLFISPEALVAGSFKAAVEEAAAAGRVSALIVDEAHLVLSWGMKFRPEYQMLPAFRDKLTELSPTGIRTILLSATFTEWDTELLKRLFGGGRGAFTEFRADRLREELCFFTGQCRSERDRRDMAALLVDQAPRPLILYTMFREQAQEYLELLRERGYQNVELFTGDTGSADRDSIMKRWRDNRTDIIVATSAFGMGVDKPDVRTIIQVYMPESINRFYQEAGRAGRDGCRAHCYWLVHEETDRDNAFSLMKSAVPTVDTILERWDALVNCISERVGSDEVWVDINVPPEHLRASITGNRNAGWNKDVLLFLYRFGLIRLLDMKRANDRDYKVLIKLLEPDILDSSQKLLEYTEPFRAVERRRVDQDIEDVRALFAARLQGQCYSDCFCETYPHAPAGCSGCPHCRERGLKPFHADGPIRMGAAATSRGGLAGLPVRLRALLAATGQVHLYLNGNPCNQAIVMVTALVSYGVELIVLPNGIDLQALLDELSFLNLGGTMLIEYHEIDRLSGTFGAGSMALFYSGISAIDERLYALSKGAGVGSGKPIVFHIAPMDLMISQARGNRLEDMMVSIPAEELVMG